ncbi:transmembrane protein 17 [Hyalella azteca]|uniref:Transmembrane protein 17 n=1 Tax=Hyalella azteca TaxID=294128 RepID=A0A8B7PLP3_HYAAZ|nr:transmembrane protein 17 [Hyalella azteca]
MTRSLQRKNSNSVFFNTIETISSTFFPNVEFDELGRLPPKVGCVLTSSLPLQMSIFFSGIFFPVWLISTYTIFYYKFWRLTTAYRYVVALVYVAVPPLEFVRLRLGYSGNIRERVPELAGSWLVVALLLLPLLLFLLLVPGCKLTAMEYPLHCFYLIILIVHIIAGHIAITRMAKYQTKIYHLQTNAQKTSMNSSRSVAKKKLK